MRKQTIVFGLLIASLMSKPATSQDAVTYKMPAKAIADLVLAPPTPSVSIDDKGQYMLLIERSSHPGIEDLAQPELRIGGLRLNPNNFGPSRASYILNYKIKDLQTNKEMQVKGLPANLKAAATQWSPQQTKFAFTHTHNNGIDLYVVNIKTGTAIKVNKSFLNIVLEDFSWEDEHTIWYNTAVKPASAAPLQPLAPKGPIVQQNLGKAAPSRTYQDLIRNPHDEALFAFYATGQLVRNANGAETKVGAPGLFSSVNISPDKKYLLVRSIDRPFSYLVTVNSFASTSVILDNNGKEIKVLAKNPSGETAPTGFDNIQNVPQRFAWRSDQPSTVYWMQPLDSGLYAKKMEHHDAVYALSAPFTGTPKELLRTNYRFYNITWGNSTTALLSEGLQRKQIGRMSRYNPTTGQIELLLERSTNDAYNNPGTPVTTKNEYGRQVLQLDGNKLLMISSGASPKGDLPFLAEFDLNQKKNNIIWRSEDGNYETIIKVLDASKKIFVTSKESQTEAPNYYVRNLTTKTVNALTNFADPQPVLRQVKKEKIMYKRKDGIDLTATLYTPAGFDAKKDEPLPVLMWAYPREFKNAGDAGQVRGSQHTFTRINYGSPVFWVTQGYAVMDATEFPIVGEGEVQPNDNFIEQLRWNAEAAINKVAEMGVGDRNRVAVGGHSYGAFMTANLLAHTDLFKAGIARSGAYNRTLTPFGFQAEERTYWQAPEIYNGMSPFSHADKIKTPILLIHGEADNNPGTFPIQSERLYNAIKGHGGTTRLVILPYESHGYAAKENLLHMLWEQQEWLEKYVMNYKKS